MPDFAPSSLSGDWERGSEGRPGEQSLRARVGKGCARGRQRWGWGCSCLSSPRAAPSPALCAPPCSLPSASHQLCLVLGRQPQTPGLGAEEGDAVPLPLPLPCFCGWQWALRAGWDWGHGRGEARSHGSCGLVLGVRDVLGAPSSHSGRHALRTPLHGRGSGPGSTGVGPRGHGSLPHLPRAGVSPGGSPRVSLMGLSV